jgi:hypothetical protein
MIDYCSVFFALGYLYFAARYLTRRGGAAAVVCAVAFGVGTGLTKVTTLPTVAVPLTWLALRRLNEDARAAGHPLAAPVVRVVAACAAMAVVPLAAAQAWVAYTDAIKAASPATAVFESGRLHAWTLGTLRQRLNPESYARILWRLDYPYLLVLGLAWGVLRAGRGGRGFTLALALSAALTALVFFNLYVVHDYYLMGVAAAVAVASGLGLYAICFRLVRRPAAQWLLLGALLCPMVGKGYHQITVRHHVPPYDVVALGAYVRSVTAPGERVVVEGADWNPEVLFAARRKGLMWAPYVQPTEGLYAIAGLFHRDNFTTVLSYEKPPETLRYWKWHRKLGVVEGFHVYRVGDSEP